MKIIKLAHNKKYLINIGIDPNIADSILPYLDSLRGSKKLKYMMNKIRNNIDQINAEKSNLLMNPNYLDVLIPFEHREPTDRYKIRKLNSDEEVMRISQDTYWDVQDPTFLSYYTGDFYIVYKNGQKYALAHPETGMVNDVVDRMLDDEERQLIFNKIESGQVA
jgi:hypothetical protein